jgi:Flp pilus assembly protein TadD
MSLKRPFLPKPPKLRFPRRPGRSTASDSKETPKGLLARLLDVIDNLQKLVLVGLGVLGVAAFCVLFALDQRPRIVVGKFSLSEQAKKTGYDNVALARELAGHISAVVSAPSSNASQRAIYDFDNEPVVDLEKNDWSLKTLTQLIERLRSKHRFVVTGELLSMEPGQARMTVRVDDSPDFDTRDSLTNVDRLMTQSAEYIVKSSEPYLYAAYALSKGREEEALDQIRFCLTHPPTSDHSWAYNLWGVYFLEKGKFSEATEKFQRAIELDPRMGVAHYNLAQSLEGQGDSAAALTSYRRALDRWNSPVVLNRYGRLLLKQGDQAKALSLLADAVRKFPSDTDLRLTLAAGYVQAGRPIDAWPHLQFVHDRVGFDATLEASVAAVAESLGRRDEALAAYRRLLENSSTNELARSRIDQIQALNMKR